MSYKASGLFPSNPVTTRGSSTKISSYNDKVIYTNGKTVIVSVICSPVEWAMRDEWCNSDQRLECVYLKFTPAVSLNRSNTYHLLVVLLPETFNGCNNLPGSCP